MEAMSQDEDLVPESNNNFNSDELTTPGVVVDQLKAVADTGIVDIDWPDLQRALKLRLKNVLDHYFERNRDCKEEQYQEPNVEKFNLDNSRDEILDLIDSFNDAPFTIQRICELLYSPFKYYDRVSTFLRGLEKNLRVISSNSWPKSQVDTTNKDDNLAGIDQSAASQQQPQQSPQQSQPHQPQQHEHQKDQESTETQENNQSNIHIDDVRDIQAEVASDIDVSKTTEQVDLANQKISDNDGGDVTEQSTNDTDKVENTAQRDEEQDKQSQDLSEKESNEEVCVQADIQ